MRLLLWMHAILPSKNYQMSFVFCPPGVRSTGKPYSDLYEPEEFGSAGGGSSGGAGGGRIWFNVTVSALLCWISDLSVGRGLWKAFELAIDKVLGLRSDNCSMQGLCFDRSEFVQPCQNIGYLTIHSVCVDTHLFVCVMWGFQLMCLQVQVLGKAETGAFLWV